MPAKGEETKKKILEKAVELFVQKGYSAVTMKDLCEATGLSRGGLYRHFKSTGEMMAMLINEEQEIADNEFKKAIAEGKSALHMLDAFIIRHQHFLLSSTSALEAAINQFALLDENGRKINEERVWSTVNRTAEVIRIGQQEGLFIDGDPEIIAWHIVFFIGGIRTQTVLENPGADFIKQQIEYLRTFLLKNK